VLGVAAVFAGCGGTDFKEKTLRLTESSGGTFSFVDNPPKTRQGKEGPEKVSNGDVLSFSTPVLDGRKPVGDIDATCTVTNAGKGRFEQAISACTAVVSLTGGSMTLSAGGKVFAGTVRGAIVGGTGDYPRASGDFTSTSGPNDTSKDVFHYFVPDD
jgi:hypothetical protein